MRLPDLLIVGAQKCGTTAARKNLDLHPHIAFNSRGGHGREVHFFDRNGNYKMGLGWYAEHFQQPAPLLAEKTPNYFQPKALERIANDLPRAKLIVLLRDPVDRAYSQWNHFNQQPRASDKPWRLLAFESALREYPALLQFGHYDEPLERMFALFPRSQVHIGIAERVRADMRQEYARMLRFLGLEPVAGANYQSEHVRRYIEPLAPAIRNRLNAYFEPHVERVRALLDDPLPEWLIEAREP